MRPASRFAAAIALGALLVALLPALPAVAAGPVRVHARGVTTSVDHRRLVHLPIEASHVVLHWIGAPEAQLSIAFGETPGALSEEVPIVPDGDVDAGPTEAFSDVLWTGGARFVQVTTDRPLANLEITAIDSTDRRPGLHLAPSVADAAVGQPTIISRAVCGPSPNTVCVASSHSGQARHSAASSRSASRLPDGAI